VTLLRLPAPLAEALRKSDLRILVTGAGGWIGSATLEMLAGALGPEAFRRHVLAFGSHARRLILRGELAIDLAPLEALAGIADGPALLLHYAFLGREKTSAMPLADYRVANARISEIVERTVARLRPRGMVLASSGAVYGPNRTLDDDFERNPYGVLKRQDELRFAEACHATGTRLVIPRVFNIAGPYINKLDSYALASFLVDALAGRPIAIRADRRIERSYVHVGDVIALCLAPLLEDESASPAPLTFDTAGERAVEVGELAEQVVEVLGRRDLPIRRPALDPAKPADRYVGDGMAMRALALRHAIAPLDLAAQIRDTAAYLRATRDDGPRRG
jgi:UDP-glucuronate decarboxylase